MSGRPPGHRSWLWGEDAWWVRVIWGAVFLFQAVLAWVRVGSGRPVFDLAWVDPAAAIFFSAAGLGFLASGLRRRRQDRNRPGRLPEDGVFEAGEQQQRG